MTRRRYIFDPPERFVAGTVGEPGDRTFFLQAREGARVVSVALEKVQVSVLAERLGELLGGAGPSRRRRTPRPRPPIRRRPTTPRPLDEPLNEAFRAGSLTLGWDVGRGAGPARGRAPRTRTARPIDPDDDDDEDEDGPDLLRVRLSAGRGPGLRRARDPRRGAPAGCPARCAARRSIPQGHICPRRNGHYVN